jgi:Short C-terminal domain
MGLIGGMARTAVVAGTATAVSNRVSRRQANRWAAKDQQEYESQAYEQQQAYDQQQAYAPQPQQVYAAPPSQPAAPTQDDMITQLQKLGELKAAGVLTEEEFAAQKAKILGS